MPIYKAKLKSIGDPSGINAQNYYNENSPYIGYVILSKSLSNNNNYGLFDDKDVTKEYLSRGDSDGLIGPEYAVDLSKIYKSSIGMAGESYSPAHLSCAALGKNIGKDENYFYHYMDIANYNNEDFGFPFDDSSGKNSIITPYSDSKYSKPLYVNFAMVGMSKAATPYINAGLFLENCERATLSDVTDFDYIAGGKVGGDSGIYEFPGHSALSTMFAEILWYGAKDAWASTSKDSSIVCELPNNISIYYDLNNTIFEIGVAIHNKLELENGDYLGEDFSKYLHNVSSVISNLVITNGSDFYEMNLLTDVGYVRNADSSSLSDWCDIIIESDNDADYIDNSYCTCRIKFFGNNRDYYKILLAVYSSDKKVSGIGINEFGKKLCDYCSSTYNEPIVFDNPSDGTNTSDFSANTYKLNIYRNRNNIETGARYYVVARPSRPFLDGTDPGINPDITKSIEDTEKEYLKRRHKSYLTRYESIGLGRGNAYKYDTSVTAQPLSTGADEYMLDSSTVSVSVLTDPSMVAFNNATAEKNGYVYVSSITLHFKGNTKSLKNEIKISSNDNTRSKTFYLNDTGLVCSGENTSRTSYKISLQSNNSVAYIGYSGVSKDSPTKLGMTCSICGSHQMVRYNSGNCNCKSYIEHLANNDAGINSQWTLLKLSGAFKIQMSGRNTYSTSLDNETDIILEAVDVELTDSTSMQVKIKYTTYKQHLVSCKDSSLNDCIKNLYSDESSDSSFFPHSHYIMKEDKGDTLYNADCVFFNSLCGSKRMNSDTIYYNDYNILSNNWESDEDKNKKISIYANESNTPVIPVGGYGNNLDSSKYTGAAYKKAALDSSTTKFTACNDPIVSSTNTFNSISTGNDVYKTIETNGTIENLNISFSRNNTLRYSLPKPDVKLAVDYKSVEFNGLSAWTFTRSMPLNAASAANPHILVYKIEAWVETIDETGNLIIDSSASAAIAISDINGDNANKVFSGRTHTINKGTVNEKTIYGVDRAVESNEVLNNIYLKYNDNETYIYNAVSTSLPIKLLEPIELPLGDNNKISDFYGGNALNYKILTCGYTANDKTNIQTMYNTIKSNITNNVQICLCSCAGTKDDIDDGVSITKDGKKVIYFGIGFYNSSDLIMPITASFGIDLTFTDSTGEKGTYPKRISLTEFIPKDSIIYMSGKNYKYSTTTDENSKIRFVKSDDLYSLNDNGLKTYDRDGNLKAGNIEVGEAVNIGGGIKDEPSTAHNEGEIHASSIETSGNKVTSLYGIFNIYSGEVNYISTGSSKITNAGIPDVLNSSNAEGATTPGAYSNYVKFMNELSGKCLTESQHICKFVHCTDNDENGGIPYVL